MMTDREEVMALVVVEKPRACLFGTIVQLFQRRGLAYHGLFEPCIWRLRSLHSIRLVSSFSLNFCSRFSCTTFSLYSLLACLNSVKRCVIVTGISPYMYRPALGCTPGLDRRLTGHLYIFLTNLEAQPSRIRLTSSHLAPFGPNPSCVRLPAYSDLTVMLVDKHRVMLVDKCSHDLAR
ncbi:hypothetical protein BU25DRAFT_115791 [Macroventuria anomochaeta]|uniref:Uncharacterized protein n=1 Tax=Macroventuria anomochaeta TaxID=301207 RepID=A0ACB6RXE7_9PLEO|nr:uncharacterized protein BU25DRAFT_115791 [Macroventuria anomochaeta]KAF2625567.1 hypothetical protein BU25DRAFT_115791 [Macroventuria anomochaeta]